MLRLHSFKTKLLLWIMPLLTLGLLSLSGGAYWYIDHVVQEELTASMLSVTAKAAESVNTWCKTLLLEPETIASTPAAKTINQSFQQIDEENANRHSFLHQKYPDIFLDIYAANREGVYHTIQQSGDRLSIFEGSIQNRDYFRSIMAGGPSQITSPLLSRTTGLPTIFVVAPITDDKQQPQGLIGTGISLEYVQHIAENLKIGKTGYGLVIAQDGSFIYHPDQSLIMKKKITDIADPEVVELGKQMLSGHSGIFHYTSQGEKKVAFYQPVPLTGWSVAATLPEAELLAPIRQMLQWLTGITALILLLIGGVIWLAANRLSRPLQEMEAHTGEIAAGNLTLEPLTVKSKDEIGSLARKFNSMAEKLRTMLHELEIKNTSLEQEITSRRQAETALQQAHDSLEIKVEEKTQELLAANQELTAMNEEIQTANSTLATMNQQLEEEIQVRCQVENDLVLRERQYRASVSLLTRPIEEVDHCLKAILQNALQLIKAPGGYIGLYDPEGTEFIIHHAVGIHESLLGEKMSAHTGMKKDVYRSGELIHTENYQCYPGLNGDERLKRLSSVVMLPLKQDGQIIGILAASWIDERHPISQEDIEVIRQFGDLASVALERASVYADNRHMAFHDSLTGLPNRASLNRYLEGEMQKARSGIASGVILFIDMDDLKMVNDNFGHSNGDAIITAAAGHIRSVLDPGAFVARLDGDKFVAILPGEENCRQAAQIAQKMLTALNREYPVADQSLHMSASIGLVIYPVDGDTAEDILKKADSAVYAAKKAGRSSWRFYDPSLQQETYEAILLTNSLRRVLERGELSLHYQPQLLPDGQTMVGFEALLRWHSPEYGQVSPLRFIPLAEKNGLITPIGQWVLEETCRFVKRLSALGWDDLHVAVNISPKQLLAGNFVSRIRAIIEAAQVKPEQIVLEVTESVLIESLEQSVEKMQQLHDFGVALALDDFGTGYSSLTYLKSLPVDILKIDKSFIDKNCTDHDQRQLVASMIELGHALNLTIVAEGVETEPQLELLQQYGCDCIQGYIFSKPLPEPAALAFLEQKRKASPAPDRP